MWRLLKKFFGFKQKIQKKEISPSEEEFENIESFLNCSADLNIKTTSDSKSNEYFSKASKIIGDNSNMTEEENIAALQSYFSGEDNFKDDETVLIENEEQILLDNKIY